MAGPVEPPAGVPTQAELVAAREQAERLREEAAEVPPAEEEEEEVVPPPLPVGIPGVELPIAGPPVPPPPPPEKKVVPPLRPPRLRLPPVRVITIRAPGEPAVVLARPAIPPRIRPLDKEPPVRVVGPPIITVGTGTKKPQQIVETADLRELRQSSPELFNILLVQGIQAYNRAVNAALFVKQQERKQFFKDNRRLPDGQWIDKGELATIKAKAPQVHKALTAQGFGAAQRIIDQQTVAAQANAAALARLRTFRVVERVPGKPPSITRLGGVDVAAYLRAKPGDTKTLEDAGFNDKQISSAVEFNNQPWVKVLPLEVWWEKVKKAGGGDLDMLEMVEFLKARPSLAKEGRELATVKPTGEKPPVSLDAFTALFLEARGEDPIGVIGFGTTKRQLELKQLAMLQYGQAYGNKELAKAGGSTAAAFVFAPARATFPEVQLSDITPMEWGIGAAQAVLLLSPLVASGIASTGAMTAARITQRALVLGSGLVFTAATVKDWDRMSEAEKVIAVTLDTIILASALPIKAGARGLVQRVKPLLVKITSPAAVREVVKEFRAAGIRLPQNTIRKLVDAMLETRLRGIARPSVVDAMGGELKASGISINKETIRRLLNAWHQAQITGRGLRTRPTPAIRVGLSKADINRLLREAGVVPKVGWATKIRRIIPNVLREVTLGQRKVRGLRLQPTQPVPSGLSRGVVRRLLKEAGLTPTQITEFMKGKLRRLAEARVLAMGRRLSQVSERLGILLRELSVAQRRGRGIRLELPRTTLKSLPKDTVRRLLREAGLSEAEIKAFLRGKPVSLTITVANKVRQLFVKYLQRWAAMLREAQVKARSVPTEVPPPLKATIPRKVRIRLFREAGLSQSEITNILRGKVSKKVRSLLQVTTVGTGRLLRTLVTAQRRSRGIPLDIPKLEGQGLSRGTIARLLGEAGLTEVQIREFLRGTVSRRVISGLRSSVKKTQQVLRGLEVGRRRSIRLEEARPFEPQLGLSREVREALLRDAGITETQIRRLLDSGSFNRALARAIRRVFGNVEAADAIVDIGNAIRLNDIKLLREGARRLELAAGAIPKQLGGGQLVARAQLMQAEPQKFLSLGRGKFDIAGAKDLGDRIKANEQFIQTAERALRRVRDPAKKAQIERVIREARKQVQVATKVKFRPLIDISEFPTGKFPLVKTVKPVSVPSIRRAPAVVPLKKAAEKAGTLVGVNPQPAEQVVIVDTRGNVRAIPIDAFRTFPIPVIANRFSTEVSTIIAAIAATSAAIQLRIRQATEVQRGRITKPAVVPKIAMVPQPIAKALPVPKEETQPLPFTVPRIRLGKPVPTPRPRVRPKPVPRLAKPKEKVAARVAEIRRGQIAWRQGEVTRQGRRVPVWYVIKWPYASVSDARRLFSVPKGAKVVKGPGSAFKTIQVLTGRAPDFILQLDLGIQDIIINRPTRKPGKRSAIKFRPDPKQKTKGRISLGGIR